MSKAKRTNKGRTIDAALLQTALDNLAERAQERLGAATMQRAHLLAGDEHGEISVSKEWITKLSEVHVDLGAASAILHAVRGLREVFDLGDPYAEFAEEDKKQDIDLEKQDIDEGGTIH